MIDPVVPSPVVAPLIVRASRGMAWARLGVVLVMLRLDLFDDEDRRYVQVTLEGLDVDEDDLKRAINLRAPHLFPNLGAAA